jgi:Fic/DOC family protein
MARRESGEIARESEIIENVIRGRPEGIKLPELLRAYADLTGRRPARRTLQRRLRRLADAGRVRVQVAARATRYFAAEGEAARGKTEGTEAAAPPTSGEVAETEERCPPLSPEGGEVRALVRRPLWQRPPVGYDTEFLERYEPGATWYLPAAVREHLHAVGRTPDAERPAGTYAREIYEQLLLDLSWSSSRLEGNRYTRIDTKELLRYGREAAGKDTTETQMILNHRAAIELLVENAERVGFNRWTFLSLHAALAENLVRDRRYEGALRTRLVDIGGSKYTPPGVPQKIEEHFDLMLKKADAIPDPFEQAFFVMVHLPYLQPFILVNKRTSRLGANIPLIRENLAPLSFVDVPERAYVDATLGVYELRRVELLRDLFAWAYERSAAQYRVVRETMGKPDPTRLLYRQPLRELVRIVVTDLRPPDPAMLCEWATEHRIPAGDIDAFVQSAREELLDLHEGSLHRYHIRPDQFAAWQDMLLGGE